MTADRLLRAKQVAELLGVSKVTVMRMGLRGDLDRVHITGRCVGYKLSQVENFIGSKLNYTQPNIEVMEKSEKQLNILMATSECKKLIKATAAIGEPLANGLVEKILREKLEIGEKNVND
jgi:predicted DNA-binding transcriptional regulator AlpA